MNDRAGEMGLQGHPLSDVISALREFVSAAEVEEAQRRAEMDAARLRVVSARDIHAQAEAELKRRRRALAALDGGLPGRIGRPRGATDPAATLSKVRTLLPSRGEWTPKAIVSALAEEGHEVTQSGVGSALSHLRTEGRAINLRRGVWAPAAAQGDA